MLLVSTLISLPAQAQIFKVLYNFQGSPDGVGPLAPVMGDAAGDLCGTTSEGGSGGCGTVFKVDSSGNETVLYNFKNQTDGCGPYQGSVVRDAAGNLYGTTDAGGKYRGGTLYKLSPAGKKTILHHFGQYPDGQGPTASLIRDRAGNLYGVTGSGGSSSSGTIFRFSKGTETVLYSFSGGKEGYEPLGALIRDLSGNLYGTTYQGGGHGYGVVFKFNPQSSTFTVLYSFQGGTDGANPWASLVRDGNGNLYGVTAYGGTTSQNCNGGGTCGTVFKVNPTTGKETVLYRFVGGTDGWTPLGGLARDAAGNLYGTTLNGGGSSCNCGTVFKVAPGGKETLLHVFEATDGAKPQAGLIRDSSGNLFGTAQLGGDHGSGVVFEVTP